MASRINGVSMFELERKEIRGSLFPLHLKGLTPGTVGEATDLSSKHSREQIDRHCWRRAVIALRITKRSNGPHSDHQA